MRNLSVLRETLSVLLATVILGQRLDDEVEPEPQAPTVMIEKNRKDQGHHEEQDQHVAVVGPDNQQEKEADHKDHELRRDHVREYRANKEPFLALEKRQAVRAMMPDVKRMGGNRRLPTGRTTQSQTTPQNPLDMFQIYFQSVGHILTPRWSKPEALTDGNHLR